MAPKQVQREALSNSFISPFQVPKTYTAEQPDVTYTGLLFPPLSPEFRFAVSFRQA
jgi:hypothetical protein